MERPFRLSDPVRRIVSTYQAALAVLSDAGEDIGADIALETEATRAGLAWETFRGARKVAGGLASWAEVAAAFGAERATLLDADTVAVWDPYGKEEGQNRRRGRRRP